MRSSLGRRTIADFGEQWRAFRRNDGYYGSPALLADLFGPLLDPARLDGARVADIGSGTGRIVNMLLDCGAAHVTAVEPSSSADVLEANVAPRRDRVTVLRARGDALPPRGDLDFVFSVGVLHHIPDPLPVVRAARAALRPGGVLAVWLYGREGNRLYLTAARPLRALTTRLPHPVLLGGCRALYPVLAAYLHACRLLPLPMHRYMRHHLVRLDRPQRVLTMYDQLNPAWARYYSRREAIDLLHRGGFADVQAAHHHGYSWSVVGRRAG